MRDFFGIEDNGYRFEIYDLMSLVTVFNVAFVIFIKFMVLFLGALGFANIYSAIFADVGVLILAVLNAMRALTFR